MQKALLACLDRFPLRHLALEFKCQVFDSDARGFYPAHNTGWVDLQEWALQLSRIAPLLERLFIRIDSSQQRQRGWRIIRGDDGVTSLDELMADEVRSSLHLSRGIGFGASA